MTKSVLTPWISALLIPTREAELGRMVRASPSAIQHLGELPAKEASELLRRGLEDSYRASSQDLEVIRDIVSIASCHARTFYASEDQFADWAMSKPRLPADPRCVMLTGPTGGGKTALFAAIQRLFVQRINAKPSADLPVFPIWPFAGVSVRDRIAKGALLGAITGAVGVESEYADGNMKDVAHARLRIYQRGCSAICADEFQFASRSSANANVTKLLTFLADIGLPLIYACNYSLGHKLKKRPPEDRRRLLSDPLLLLSLTADDPAFVGYLCDAQEVFDGMLAIDPKKDADDIHAKTFGLREFVKRLLVFAYVVARNEHRGRSGPVKVTMDHVKAAYASRSYEDDRRTVDDSFAALLRTQGLQDYVCPFELPPSKQALLKEIADRRQQYVVDQAAAAASQTKQERVASQAIQDQRGSTTRRAKSVTQRPRVSTPRTANDLLAGL